MDMKIDEQEVFKIAQELFKNNSHIKLTLRPLSTFFTENAKHNAGRLFDWEFICIDCSRPITKNHFFKLEGKIKERLGESYKSWAYTTDVSEKGRRLEKITSFSFLCKPINKCWERIK